MRFRRTIVFLLVLVAALASALVAVRVLRKAPPARRGERLYPMEPESVVALQWDVESPNGRRARLEIVREGELWRMLRPYAGTVCDRLAMADALDAALSLRVQATFGEMRQEAFRPDRRLTLRTADREVTCGFGEIQPMRLSETLAKTSRGALAAVDAAAVERLPRTAAALRGKAVLPVPGERILSLEWRESGRPFTRAVRMANGNWSVTQPFPFEQKAELVAAALEQLTSPSAVAAYVSPADGDAFADTGLAPACPTSEAALTRYGLDEERALRLTIRVRGLGESLTLRFGAADPARPDHVFCLLDGYQAVVSVPSALRALFGEQGPFATDYRNLPVLGDVASPKQLSLRAAGDATPTEFVYEHGLWSIVRPVALPADAKLVTAMVDGLASLTGNLVGLEPPEGEPLCSATLSGGESSADLRLYPSEEPETELFVYRVDTRRLYLVGSAHVPAAVLGGGYSHALADRTLFSEPADAIRRISVLRRDGSQTTVGRHGPLKEWETESPKGAYVETATVERWLQQFAELKAVQVLRELPTASGALKPYGLDRPLLRLTLDLGGGESEKGVQSSLRRILLVGSPNPGTGCAPAVIQGRPILYELDAETVKLLSLPLASAPAQDDAALSPLTEDL